MPHGLNIAVVGPSRFGIAEPYAGGLEAHTAALSRALSVLGHRVTVFAGSPQDRQPRDLRVMPVVDRPLRVGADERVDITTPADWAALERAGYGAVLARIAAGNFDIVHNTSLHYLVPTLEAELGVAMVHSLHTPPFAWLQQAHTRRHKPEGAVVTAVSGALADLWDGVVTDVVPNGVDTDFWKPTPWVQRAGAVWAGRIVPEKAPHLAIDAARSAGISIVLAGPVQDPVYFRTEVEPRLGVDAVHVGHCDSARLRELFAGAQVGVVTPCWEEPFCLVAAEMLACGTPVAGFDRGGLGSVVEPAVGELVEGSDSGALAVAIRQVWGLEADTCRKHALDSLSALVMAQRYVALYDRRSAA